ncbi:MAG: DUF6427 family protein [Bacteroidales bacterium]|nr:DUF6427 family protein [Bacteroidales bacterium]
MLIKLTKSNPIWGYVVLVVFCFLLSLKEWFFCNSSFVFEHAAVAGIILLCSIFLTIIVRNQALSKNFIISGLFLIILYFSDPFFGDTKSALQLALKMFVAIIAFFYLLRSFDKISGYVSLFNGAFLFSCISVFDPVFIFALPFIWITLLVYSDNNYRSWIISLMAIFLPYLIYFSFYFLVDDLLSVGAAFDKFFNMSVFAFSEWDNAFILPIIEFAIGIIAFIGQIKNLRGDIVYRKKTALFLVAFIYFSLFAVLFYNQSAAHIVLPVVTAFLTGKYFHYAKKSWIAETVLWGLIISTCILCF